MAGAYALGIVEGPIVAAVGGLALITWGRAALIDRAAGLVGAGGLAIVAAATGVAAIRWGTLEVSELQGAQAVLGPTVATGTQALAAWSAAAAVAGLIGVGLWMATAPPPRAWGILEGVIVATTLAVGFGVLPIATTFVGTAALAASGVVVALGIGAIARVLAEPRVAAASAGLALVATAAAAAAISVIR